VTPDEYYVFKTNLKPGLVPIISKNLGAKLKKLVYNTDAKGPNIKGMATTEAERGQYVLTDKEILQLAKWAVQIEVHYKNRWTWRAKDGDWKLFIVQARLETVRSRRCQFLEEHILHGSGKLYLLVLQSEPKLQRQYVIENVST
jgi:pyruvate,water dikinase